MFCPHFVLNITLVHQVEELARRQGRS